MANKKRPLIKLVVSDVKDEKPAVTFTSLVDNPAIESDWMAFSVQEKTFQQPFTFEITSQERRFITGAAMIPDKKIYRRDDFGEYDVVFDKETIESVVKKWSKFSFHNKVNIMHSPDAKPEGVYLYNSIVTDKEMGISAPACFKEDFPDGTWFHTYYVENDAVWEMVKQGKLKGFSVEGLFAMEDAFARFKKEVQDEIDESLEILKALSKKVTTQNA